MVVKKILKLSAVYFDSSALYDPLRKFSDAEWGSLKEYASLLKAPLFLPDVVMKELQNQAKLSVEAGLTKILNLSNSTNELLPEAKRLTINPQIGAANLEPAVLKDMQDSAMSEIETQLRFNKLNIVSNFVVPQEHMVKMAIDRIRPFTEKGEKGFRDTIILYSVLVHAKEVGHKSIILVSADGAFDHEDVQSLAKNYVDNLLICKNIKETCDCIADLIDRKIKNMVDAEAEKVRLQLLKDNTQIENYLLQRCEFSPSFLSKEQIWMSDIKKIESINVEGINDIRRNPASSKNDFEGEIKVSAVLELKFKVVAQKYERSPTKRLRAAAVPSSGDQVLDDLISYTVTKGTTTLEEIKEIKQKFTIEVSYHFKDGIYSNLQIQRIRETDLLSSLFNPGIVVR